jgi:UDP-N-acetylglucosamine 2-epimerase (non-hydrolysing)
MIKVLSVFGTRPEAVKMAPVVAALSAAPGIESKVLVTAQHREMLDQVLRLFKIEPDFDLNVMEGNQTPCQVAAAVLSRLEPILRADPPDWVLVQGDTTTVVAASLAAFYAGVKVGHVEAGLRTFDKYQPFPEEINRRVASVVADLHFAPTQGARQNLLREGVPDSVVHVTGNPVIDALLTVVAMPYDPESGPLNGVPWDKRILLVTAHRRESLGEPIEHICLALRDIALQYAGDVHIVYPVHPNPNVQGPVRNMLGNIAAITLTEPLGYLPLVYLMRHATLVLTDSGGIQEEAPGLGKPVLVLRKVTERPEAVQAGTVKVVGTESQTIVRETRRLLDDRTEYARMAHAVNPYGDGHASERIVAALTGELCAPFAPKANPKKVTMEEAGGELSGALSG